MNKTESEDLATRLCSLYKLYDCEKELPEHSDLVAKLNEIKPRARATFNAVLKRGDPYPISYEKALEIVKNNSNAHVDGFLAGMEAALGGKPDLTQKTEEEQARELMQFHNQKIAPKRFDDLKRNLQHYFKP